MIPPSTAPLPWRRALILAGLYVLFVVALFFAFFEFLLPRAIPPGHGLWYDFRHYLTHVERITRELPLYWPWPDFGPHVLWDGGEAFPPGRMPYPPILTAALWCISRFGLGALVAAWMIAIGAGYWTYIACLVRLVRGRITLGWTVSAGMLALFFPGMTLALWSGNADPILWGFAGLAVTVPALRGGGLMAIALVKLYGIFPLAFAARREGWPVLRSAFGAAWVAALMGMFVLGPVDFVTACLDWFRYALPTAGQGYWKMLNLSLGFAGLRLVALLGWEYVPGPLPSLARAYLTTVSVGAPLLVGWLSRHHSVPVQVSLVIAAAVLFSPTMWLNSVPILLLPAAALIGAARESRQEAAIPASSELVGAR